MRVEIDDPYSFFTVLDLDTKEEIKDVIWADSSTGEYEQYDRNDSGELIYLKNRLGEPFDIRSQVKTGNIKLVDSRIEGIYKR